SAVFHSPDNGVNWEPFPPLQITIDALTVDAAGTLYASSDYSLFRRSPSSWERVNTPGISRLVVPDPHEPDLVYVATLEDIVRLPRGAPAEHFPLPRGAYPSALLVD